MNPFDSVDSSREGTSSLTGLGKCSPCLASTTKGGGPFHGKPRKQPTAPGLVPPLPPSPASPDFTLAWSVSQLFAAAHHRSIGASPPASIF